MFLKSHTPDDRLRIWREFRSQDFESIEEVLRDLAKIKIRPRYIDYHTPDSWPNALEIVKEGYFCSSGVTLLLVSLLLHKGFINTDEIELPVISNHITGTEGLVLQHDKKYYNFLASKAVDKKTVKENGTFYNHHTVSSSAFLQ